jgi:nitrate reductase gamma subunit
MEIPEMSESTLHVAEIVHWTALASMAIVYTARLLWLLSFKKAKDRSAPGGEGRTSAQEGAYYSLLNIAMPWSMESTRHGMFFYFTFVVFHLGVVCGIALAFISTLAPAFLANPTVATIFGAFLAGAFLVGIGRMIRRLVVPHMRLISTPDDYFSLFMLICWFGLGIVTQASIAGVQALSGAGYLVAYLYATSFFLLYVPFSKISHYLYYPFTRWWIGKSLGHRGSLPVARG